MNLLTKILKKKKNKKYWVGFYNLPNITSLNSTISKNINKLICISGIVTRVSEPYPQLIYGSFLCENYDCKFKIDYVEQFLDYKEPKICPKCHSLNTWTLVFENSIFIQYQKIRIQEVNNEISNADIPQTFDLFLKEDLVDIVKPGDKCFFNGFLTISSGKIKNSYLNEAFVNQDELLKFNSNFFNQTFYGTHFQTCFMVNHLFSMDLKFMREIPESYETYSNFSSSFFFSRKDKEKILKIRAKENLIKNLVQSFAPSLRNFDNIKIGILLLLVGGVRKKTEENINLRGNINVGLIGNLFFDKNQLLKSFFEFFSRTIFVSGKTSTGAGLTASIMKDCEKNNFFIQAGALMLSDKGICYIEHLNKLKFQNQFSIYEAMEHQTISVAKANIKATLNARSSVFATIDLEKKSYDKTVNIQKNSGLTFSIFSRFDLFFLFLDHPFEKWDFSFSKNILNLHYLKKRQNLKKDFLNSIELYISFARLLKPVLTKKSGLLLIRIYKYLRKCQFLENFQINYFTIRQLESLIRLSEGFSKLYLGKFVKEFHVKAAGRLLFQSLYPFNKSFKFQFFKIFPKKYYSRFEKKKEKTQKKSNKIKLSFREFQLIFKSLLFEIKNLKNFGFHGVSLKTIFKKIMKAHYFSFSKQQRGIQIKKMLLVIRYMLFSYHNLMILKTKTSPKVKNFNRLIFLKK